MPAVVACPKCKAKYKLPDQMVGKPVQCKACQTRFQVGQPRKALPDKSAGTAVAPKAISPEQRAEMGKLGIDGPLQSRPDLFGGGPISAADPLANHVVEDPGFGGYGIETNQAEEASVEEEQDDYAAVFVNPAIVAPKQSKSKVDPLAQYLDNDSELAASMEGAGQQVSQQAGWLKVGFLFLFFLLAFVLSFTSDTMFVPVIAFICCFFITGIVGLVLAIKASICVAKNTDSAVLGVVSFFVGPLLIYFLFAHWSKPYSTKNLLLSFIALFVVQAVGFAMFVTSLLISGIRDPRSLFYQ